MHDHALLLLRLMTGLMLFWLHGWVKAVGVWKYITIGQPWPFLSMVKSMGMPMAGLGAMASTIAESACALLLAIGLLTRWSAGAIVINMLAACYFHHARNERPELAALYLTCAAAILIAGPGRFSLDEKGAGPRRRR